MTNLQAEIPQRLLEEAERFVEAGRHRDLDGLVADALRRYLDSHSETSMEKFIEEDIEWGLHGSN
ncbi:MAG: CopG family transcriptional regulator [Acidobacteriota bacterium]|nr:CopG family transcriptional regulator [Acidobacteriota bacterium]